MEARIYHSTMPRRWTAEEEAEKRQEIVELYERQNLPIEKIARILEITQATVYDRLLRFNIKIRKELRPRCTKARTIPVPALSGDLAEFCGVMLGDGHIGTGQLWVTINAHTDLGYVPYVQDLFERLFSYRPRLRAYRDGTVALYLTSSSLVRNLITIGLISPNKVRDQVGVPGWIFSSLDYRRRFVRGFFDTDGSIYRLKHFNAVQMSFSNRSMPLLDGTRYALLDLGYHPSRVSDHSVYLTRRADISEIRRGNRLRERQASIPGQGLRHHTSQPVGIEGRRPSVSGLSYGGLHRQLPMLARPRRLVRKLLLVTPLQIRPFVDRDYPALLAVWNAVFEEYPLSERWARHQDARYDGERYLLRRFVAEVDGAVAGTAEYHHETHMYHPRKFFLDVRVRPEFRQRGIGSALYDHLMHDLAARAPQTLWSNVRETFTEGLTFAEHRGFRESRRAWESRLDVARFDPGPFQANADRAVEGFRVVTAASEQSADPRWLEKLHELHVAVAADVPQPEPYTPLTVDELRQRWLENPEYLPDGHFLVKDGDRYVAESNLFLTERPPDVLYQGITGTLREYRGRGLAFALKLRTIEYARRHGKREIRTWNDTLNEPMLAINVRLGFVRQPAWITFERSLDHGDGGSP